MAKSELGTPTLTTETAVDILMKTLDKLDTPENEQKLAEAKKAVGNEMLKMMQFVFPIVMQVQMEVLKEFGFSEGKESIIKFTQMLRAIEREDSDVARLHSLIKAYYLPPVAVNSSIDAAVDEGLVS